ncbi:sugar phosphate isomerase family [Dactylosporangium cerinum]
MILLGGVREASGALVGPVAEAAAGRLNVDALFLDAHGMTVRTGFTAGSLAAAGVDRRLVASARRLVVLADHSRWGSPASRPSPASTRRTSSSPTTGSPTTRTWRSPTTRAAWSSPPPPPAADVPARGHGTRSCPRWSAAFPVSHGVPRTARTPTPRWSDTSCQQHPGRHTGDTP